MLLFSLIVWTLIIKNNFNVIQILFRTGVRFTKVKSAGFSKSRQGSRPRYQYLELLDGFEILRGSSGVRLRRRL